MSYRLVQQEAVADGIRRIAREQLDKALAELEDDSIDRHETVHQVRKRCKKLRGLVRLVRPCMEETYQAENAWHRDSAKALSDIRDAQALVESCDALLEHYDKIIPTETFADLRSELVRRREESIAAPEDVERRLEEFQQRMVDGRERVHAWPMEETGFDLLEDGLTKTYRRGRKAMQKAYAEPSVGAFHEWRKRVKYHWYHARILRDTWKPVLSSYVDELKRLSDLLGDDHDLAVLRETVAADPGSFGARETIQAFLGLIDQRQADLRSQARPLGARVFAEQPTRHGRRLRAYWQAWRDIEVARFG